MVVALHLAASASTVAARGQAPAQPPPAEQPALDHTTEVQPATPVDVPASENPRTWRVLKALAESLNAEDSERFLSLFSPELVARRAAANDPLEDTLGFMSRAMAQRGSIGRFYPLSPKGLQIGGSAAPVRIAVFLFDDGTTGYFGIALDEDGKIADFSHFVLPGLCAQSPGRCQGEPIPLDALPVGG